MTKLENLGSREGPGAGPHGLPSAPSPTKACASPGRSYYPACFLGG